ncbi:MAG: type VI secretion system tip protein VgrG [Gammaproteobacteria bacterium]|nr:type VI secretion system tip protein VgrG [Gammaproteobacteria bacterium]
MYIENMTTISQQGRLLEIKGPNALKDCVLTHVHGQEGIFEEFQFDLTLLSDNTELNQDDLLGKKATIKLHHSVSGTRTFNGIIASFHAGNIDYHNRRTYLLAIRPWFESLSLVSDCRIFQNLTPIQIFTMICKEHNFPDYDIASLRKNHEPLEYCVQYNETSLYFLKRILADAGIYYIYRHTEDRHILMLLDNSVLPKKYPDPVLYTNHHHSKEHISKWRPSATMHATQLTVEGFDLNHAKPEDKLITATRKTTQDPVGGLNIEHNYHHSRGFSNQKEAEKKAKLITEHLVWQSNPIEAGSNLLNLTPNIQFTLSSEDNSNDDGNFRVLTIEHIAKDITHTSHEPEANEIQQHYENKLLCIPASLNYVPPQDIKRPKITNDQSAVVVGPKDKKVYTNKQGQVKVQFHWDRYGKSDENSSCWLRVMQASSGANWGTQFIPRIGSEVIVSFLNADPDRPIVTGSAYNGANQEPFPLPDNQNLSGIKTHIEDDKDNSNRGHELVFDDTPGKERFILKSEGLLTVNINNSSTHTVKENESIHVKGNNVLQVNKGKANMTAKELHLIVGGSSMVLDDNGVTIKPAGKLHLLAKGVGETKPVARVGDDHKCPKKTGTTPHVGGPVLKGSPISKANGMAVARVGDNVKCNSGTDKISQGVDSIQVDGKAIAKVNSQSTHGGVVVRGSDNVMVGETKGSSFTVRKNKIIYMVDAPKTKPQLHTQVKKQNKKSIPLNSDYKYDLQLTQQNGALDIFFQNQPFAIFDDINYLRYNDKGEAPVYIGERLLKVEEKMLTPEKQAESIDDNGNNLVFLATAGAIPADLEEQLYDVEQTSEDIIGWVVKQMSRININVAMGGKDAVDLLKNQNNRQFLLDFMRRGSFSVKKIKGTLYIIFGGKRGLRSWVKGTRYRADNPKVTVMHVISKLASGDSAEIADAIKGAAKDSGLGLIVIGPLDAIKYYTNPDKHKEFSDLIVDILGDVVKYFVATVLVAALCVFLAEAAIPLAVIVVVGIVAVGFIGAMLDLAEDDTGLHAELTKIGRNCESFLKKHKYDIAKIGNTLSVINSNGLTPTY